MLQNDHQICQYTCSSGCSNWYRYSMFVPAMSRNFLISAFRIVCNEECLIVKRRTLQTSRDNTGHCGHVLFSRTTCFCAVNLKRNKIHHDIMNLPLFENMYLDIRWACTVNKYTISITLRYRHQIQRNSH